LWKLAGGIGTDTPFVLKAVIRPPLRVEMFIGRKTKSVRTGKRRPEEAAESNLQKYIRPNEQVVKRELETIGTFTRPAA
jgi:hypothetical protein